jgi:hypothetical protein
MNDDRLNEFPRESLNRVHRLPERGVYDRAEIYAIIDEALICHLSFVQNGQPFIIPINHARDGDHIILHGSHSSRLIQHVCSGAPVCLAFTLVDGLVLARSVLHSDMNYRSAIVFGHGASIDDAEHKLEALRLITNHLAQGRWEEARQPSQKELLSTALVSIQIESASAKKRSGMPQDDEADYVLPVWAGVLPFEVHADTPIPDPRLDARISVPSYLSHYQRKGK